MMLQPNTSTCALLAPPLGRDEKRCPRCGAVLKLSQFGTCVSRHDGKNLYCPNCARDKVEQSRMEARAARAAFQERLRRLPSKAKARRANPLSPTCKTCGAVATPALKVWLRRGWQNRVCLALARKRYHRREGGETCMGRAEEQAFKLAKLPDRIAAILAKSVAVRDDAFDIDDAEALIMILDIINELDPTLIERNANKQLARHLKPS
jgi:hypothetical protein